MSATARREAIVAAAAELPDADLLELHREVSRLATRARQRDPEYRARHELGVQAARGKMLATLDIAAREDEGQ